MPSEIKNEISHRGKALKALKEFFEEGELRTRTQKSKKP